MKIIRAWLPAALWMVVIFIFSSRESVKLDERFIVNFIFFKTLHVIEYGILYLLYWRALKNKAAAFILTIAYAVTDELHQALVPTREARVRDVIIDTIGAIFAWIFLTRVLPRMPKKLRSWVGRLGVS